MTSRPDFRPVKTIALVGLMGAGKTTIGKRLADRLGLAFVDADSEIEAAAGATIQEIFDTHGEQAFRDGERRVIARLLDGEIKVLATGGGAFMNEETRKRLKADAISVWLKAELEVLHRRVRRRNHRPLLRGGDAREVLAKLIEERYPVYAGADITIETGEGPHSDVVDRILTELKAYADTGEGTASANS